MFIVGGLGFEFCVFVAGWRHALRSVWPFIIIIFIHPSVASVAECWSCCAAQALQSLHMPAEGDSFNSSSV